MKKAVHLAINLALILSVLFGPASIKAQAVPPAHSGSDPLEAPPIRLNLLPGRSLLSTSTASSAPDGQDQTAPAWQNPITYTCVVYSALDTTALDFDLYATNPQTGQYQRLFTSPDDEIEPRFNHGCTKILYTVAPAKSGKEDLYLINPDGSGQLRLTQNQGNNYNGAWSRDGSKIAFTSDRDGQPEIYVMNADGSSVTRLTYNGGDQNHNYDDMPAWSPDGAKIAFSSNRTGGYRIWVMNADGSNPVQLSAQPYSFRPQWSPDGSTILFDAADSAIGTPFQKLYMMAADGSNQNELFINGTSANSTDILSEGWSPDNKYIYFSVVSWVNISNNWYWTTSYNYFWSTAKNGSIISLTPGDVDWYPSWETYDNLPPITRLVPLPTFTRGTQVNLQCVSQDPGGSGIDSSELDYRDAADSTWTILGECQSSHLFGTSGHTYYFRARAVDKVKNAEAWHGGIDGDTHTTLYDSSIIGSIHDASGVPLAGTNPIFSTTPVISYPAGREGMFSYYFSLYYNYPFSITWNNAAYGSLPPVNPTPNENYVLNAYLPPADNIIANPGFESGAFGSSDWTTHGDIPPMVVTDPVHTGLYASQLGTVPAFTTPKDFGSSNNQIAVDGSGVVHAAWVQAGNLVYARRGLDGIWSTPQAIPGGGSSVLINFGVDSQNTVHVFYSNASGSFYTCLSSGGAWLPPVAAPTNSAGSSSPQSIPEGTGSVMDPNGHWYFASVSYSQIPARIFVTEVYNGQWSSPQPIATVTSFRQLQLALSPDGTVGLVWIEDLPCETMCYYGDYALFYAEKKAGFAWSAPERLTKFTDLQISKVKMTYSVNGEARLVWGVFDPNGGTDLYFINRSPSGEWSDPIKLDPVPTRNLPYDLETVEGPDGAFYVIYRYSDWENDPAFINAGIMLTRRSPDGVWSLPTPLPWTTKRSQLTQMAIDSQNRLHFAWNEAGWVGNQYQSTINYACLQQDGSYVLGQPLPDPNSNLDPLSQFILGPDQTVHLVWRNYYSSFKMNNPEGDSTLSQEVQVPPAGSFPGLSFIYLVPHNLLPDVLFSVQIIGADHTTTTLFSTQDITNGWAHQWINLAPWAGQGATLTFNLHQTAGILGAAVYLDEVYLGSTHPDIWLNASSAHALPGSQVVVPITFGNQGRVPAAGSQLTLTLPAGVTFVSASVAPTATSPNLTWDLGDLPAQSGPTTLWVTLQVDAGAPPFTSLAGSLAIAAPGELETANNTAPVTIFTSQQVFLPSLTR